MLGGKIIIRSYVNFNKNLNILVINFNHYCYCKNID